MSAADRAAFLRAIAANPDDDLPRLVYADWLDEHGEPERAEFIRVQCELARLPPGEQRFSELKRRERDLLAAHEAVWRPGPPDRLTLGAFERGFIQAVTAAQFHAFLSGIWDVLAHHPITQIRIHLMRSAQLRRLAQFRPLSAVTELDVSGGTIGNDPVPAFARSTNIRRLRFLDLSNHRIGDVGAQTLAETDTLPRLQTLALRNNRISDTGAEALAASPFLGELKVLLLQGNPMSQEGHALLRARFGAAVRL